MLKSYLISAGNTNVGTIGFTVRIFARSEAEALKVAGVLLPWDMELKRMIDPDYAGLFEYFNVYISPQNITVEEDIVTGETSDPSEYLTPEAIAEIIKQLDELKADNYGD